MIQFNNHFLGGTPMLFFKPKKGYCRYAGRTCPKFKTDKKKKCFSFCNASGKIISETTPKGDNTIIKAPHWCPRKK